MTISKRNILSFLFLVAGCTLLKKYEIASVNGFPNEASGTESSTQSSGSEASTNTPSPSSGSGGSSTKTPNANEKIPESQAKPPKKGAYYNHTDIEALGKSCDKAKDCQASKMYQIVCGSDGAMYRNIGVFTCAQKCNMNLKIKNVGPCKGAVPVNTKKVPPSNNGNAKPGDEEGQPDSNDTAEQAPLTDEMRIALKQRIRERTSHYRFPPVVEEYCKNHTKRCRYGFDPRKNVSWYLLPGRRFNWGGELGKWGDGRKQHKMFHKDQYN